MIDYHEVTREELIAFQQAAYDRGDDMAVRVSAEAIRLMGLARMWKQRAEKAEPVLKEMTVVVQQMEQTFEDLTAKGYLEKRP